MQVYIFLSERTPGVRAFTSDQTGTVLPIEYAPWRAVREMYLGSASDPISHDIETKNYLLVGIDVVESAAAD